MKQHKRVVRKAMIVAAVEMDRRVGGDGLTMGRIAEKIGVSRTMHLYGMVRELVSEGVLLQRDEYYRPTFLKVMYSINPGWLVAQQGELYIRVMQQLGSMQKPLPEHDIMINGKSWIFYQSKRQQPEGNYHTISPYTITGK